MNEFIKILLSLSVSGTLLLLLILGLKRFYRNKFSRGWQYYIWIIVVLRFLLPLTPDTTIVGSLFEKSDIIKMVNEGAVNPDVPAGISAGGNEGGQIQEDKSVTVKENADVIVNTAAYLPFGIYTCLFFIWAVPALLLFVRKIILYQRLILCVKGSNTEVSDINTLNLLSDCEEKLSIKTKAKLYHNALIASPVMIGFFRPEIVLPAKEQEEKELSYIFVHELIHYRRKDIFYKWLIQIAVCIHWFNPFIYLLEKEVNKSCELACDEKVISLLGEEARREYGDTLISFLKSDNSCKGFSALATLTERAEEMKERLEAIMHFRKKTKFITIISLITAFLLSASGFAIGAYAAHPVSQENKTDLTGYIMAQENKSVIKENKSIIHESADILYYEDGSPYIHDILTNNTEKRIVETEYCILAYNEKGLPLKLRWNFTDSSAKSTYENLVRTKTKILPDQTEDYQGGWSLYDGELTENMPKTENGEADQAVYALLCLKQVVFEDGMVWDNPNYEDWFKAYAGKETDVDELQDYYPYKYELESD